jgi:hypothetical protein
MHPNGHQPRGQKLGNSHTQDQTEEFVFRLGDWRLSCLLLGIAGCGLFRVSFSMRLRKYGQPLYFEPCSPILQSAQAGMKFGS